MRRFIIILVAVMTLPIVVYSDVPDISELTYDELIELRQQINLAIWNCEEWQEVEVPAGIWEIGKDIPSGHWTITPAPNTYIAFSYVDKLNESGSGVGYGWDIINGFNDILTSKKNKDGTWKNPDELHQIDLILKDGWFIINKGTVIFTPYTGKPDLGFR